MAFKPSAMPAYVKIKSRIQTKTAPSNESRLVRVRLEMRSPIAIYDIRYSSITPIESNR
jgi:hypothetical protein